jgi:hypothetical protein
MPRSNRPENAESLAGSLAMGEELGAAAVKLR